MHNRCNNCFIECDGSLGIFCPECGYAEGDGPKEALHLAPGRVLKDTYIIGKVLGYGGFGVTYLAWNKVLEQKVAIKEYLPSEFSTRMPGQTQVTVFTGEKSEQFSDGIAKFVDEANRLAQFRNTDGIVRIFESFYENKTAYIVMELLDGQTLTKYLEKTGNLSGDETVRLLTPIIQSLRVVHGQGIIHRDIAPDNIIVTKDGQVKLIDFGAARYATTSRSRSLTVVIKPGYSPEEQYRSRGDQGPWTDVYAVGATMYRMITGKTPPDAMERRAFFEGKKKDILTPISKLVPKNQVTENQETAILNAMNVRIEDRTPDMEAFENELTSTGEVPRRGNNIKITDVLSWPLWAKITVPTAACIALTLLALFFTGVIGNFDAMIGIFTRVPEGMTKVPSVENRSVERAEERTKDKLNLIIVGKEESSSIPANMVLTQDVSAGSVVPLNSELKVVVSAGVDVDVTQIQTVADVQYRTKEQATQMLESQGLTAVVIEESSEVVEKGLVISQNPAPDKSLDNITEVTIVVSTGMPIVIPEAPDIEGIVYWGAEDMAGFAEGFANWPGSDWLGWQGRIWADGSGRLTRSGGWETANRNPRIEYEREKLKISDRVDEWEALDVLIGGLADGDYVLTVTFSADSALSFKITVADHDAPNLWNYTDSDVIASGVGDRVTLSASFRVKDQMGGPGFTQNRFRLNATQGHDYYIESILIYAVT